MKGRRRDSGFTLLEVLVSLTVLAFLMIGLNQGVRTGLDLWNMQSRQMNRRTGLDATFRVLRTLLSDIPRNPATPANSRAPSLAISFNGTTDQIAFVGNLPTGLGNNRLADIRILLRDERLILAWKQHRHEVTSTIPAVIESELLGAVSRVEFAYFGVSIPGSPAGWVTEWAGPSIPELIRIRFNFVKTSAPSWPDLIVAPQLATSST